jgi:ketosteroid isomerase-like protein
VTTGPDLIRELNDAVERQDWAALSERMHRDVVWSHNVGLGTPEEGEYKGRDSVVALFERILEPWEHMRATQNEVRDLGGGVFLIRGELHAKHKAVGEELVTPYEQRLEFHGGLLLRGEMVSRSGAHLAELKEEPG